MQPCDRLTAKEIQVAMLVWEGQTNREIASVISSTEQVIKNYLRNTFDKVFGAAWSWHSTYRARRRSLREPALTSPSASSNRQVVDPLPPSAQRPPILTRVSNGQG
jgi:hypothetical protein